jgi:hypothetical protein
MDERELAEFLPNVPEYIEGTADFDVLVPPGLDSHGVWRLRFSPALVVLRIHKNAVLAITAGLALDVPYNRDVSHHINHLNATDLTVGRMFVKEFEGTGRGAIVMQEIVYCQDMAGPPSLSTLLRIIGKVGGVAARLAPDLCQQFGGHVPPDDTDLLLVTLE